MNILIAVGVTILTAGAAQSSQPAGLVTGEPINVTFVNAPFEDALTMLAKASGVTIEIDQTVTQAQRREPVYDSPIRLRDVSLEGALDTLTRLKGLSYSIVSAKMVLIYKKV
jgi:hypothetical protein